MRCCRCRTQNRECCWPWTCRWVEFCGWLWSVYISDKSPLAPLHPFIYGGLEGVVELLQGALERQMCQRGAGGEVALSPSGDFHLQRFGQHFLVGQLLAGNGVQGVVQSLHSLLQALVLTNLFQGDCGHLTPPAGTRS